MPSPSNPLGAKGAGEAGATGAVPALANAVMDALATFGIRELDTPFTPFRVWSAIRSARVAEAESVAALNSRSPPASRRILTFRSVSFLMMASNCSGVLVAGTEPCCCMRSRTSGIWITVATSRLILSRKGCGVRAGAIMPNQDSYL